MAAVKKAVFTFGRFQPLHSKHGELIDSVIKNAEEVHGDAFLFTSKKDNNFDDAEKWAKYQKVGEGTKIKKKLSENPFKIADKLQILNFYHGHKNIQIVDVGAENITTPFEAVAWLKGKGYTKIIIVVGEDRVQSLTPGMTGRGVEVVGISRPGGSASAISGTHLRNKSLDIILDEAIKFVDIYKDIDGERECLARNKQILDIIDLIRRGSTGHTGGKRKRRSRKRRRRRTKKRRQKYRRKTKRKIKNSRKRRKRK